MSDAVQVVRIIQFLGSLASHTVCKKPDGFCQSRFVLETVTPFLNVKGAVGDFGKPIGAFGLAVGAVCPIVSLLP